MQRRKTCFASETLSRCGEDALDCAVWQEVVLCGGQPSLPTADD
jgi:hypothetical protein